MLAHLLTDGIARQCRKSNHRCRSNGEKVTPIHRIPPSTRSLPCAREHAERLAEDQQEEGLLRVKCPPTARSLPVVVSQSSACQQQRQLAEDYTNSSDDERGLIALSAGTNAGPQCPVRVKSGKAQNEHMFSGLPPATDIRQHGWHVGSGPGADIALSGWTALKNGDMELTMASGAVFHLGTTALTGIS
jgi:hypothetical protein